jgi:hypothetical protein
MEIWSAMRTGNEVLIAFFESKREAQGGLALLDATPARCRRGMRAVLVNKEGDCSRSAIEPPWVLPAGAVLGAGFGGILGLLGGEVGVVVGLFFGLYAGVFVDLWRTLTRADLLDEIQAGLAPGHAALVTFVRGSASAIEGMLAATDAVVAHRFPGIPIEDDFAREVGETTTELGRLAAAWEAVGDSSVEWERRIAAARRKLSVLEPYVSRLVWLDRLQFEVEMGVLNRELRGSPRWRAGYLRRKATRLRTSYRRSRAMLEASSARLRAPELQGESTGMPGGSAPV